MLRRDLAISAAFFVAFLACVGTLVWGQSGVGGGQSNVGGGLNAVGSTTFCGTTVACAGTAQSNIKLIYGRAPLTSGTPSTAVLTGLPFTSAASYSCTTSDGTSVQPIEITYTSGSSATFTGAATVTDIISYICTGT